MEEKKSSSASAINLDSLLNTKTLSSQPKSGNSGKLSSKMEEKESWRMLCRRLILPGSGVSGIVRGLAAHWNQPGCRSVWLPGSILLALMRVWGRGSLGRLASARVCWATLSSWVRMVRCFVAGLGFAGLAFRVGFGGHLARAWALGWRYWGDSGGLCRCSTPLLTLHAHTHV